jgi:hypothetical protein
VDQPRVAVPRIRFQLEGRPWLVRAFYDVYSALPYVSQHLVGAGVYAVNEAGRARFGRFPTTTADDLFVQRLFTAEERIVVPADFGVRVPHTVAGLINIRTRTALGNAELAQVNPDDDRFATSGRETVASLVSLVRARPRLLPGAVVYVTVTLVSRLRAHRRLTQGDLSWQRDSSTR